jgi:hypothetical protein
VTGDPCTVHPSAIISLTFADSSPTVAAETSSYRFAPPPFCRHSLHPPYRSPATAEKRRCPAQTAGRRGGCHPARSLLGRRARPPARFASRRLSSKRTRHLFSVPGTYS